ncbi:MAG: hypothetical protein M3P50_02530 [Actinomycetota bacterium]|nr:hypothetical protein [Actinomycetota bacterium]
MADTRLTRREREQRAYLSGLVAGGGALATVVTLVLSIIGVVGFGIVLLCAIVTVVAGLLFRRSVT